MYSNGHMADNNIDKFCEYKSDENYSLFSLLTPVYFHFFFFFLKETTSHIGNGIYLLFCFLILSLHGFPYLLCQ